MGDTSFDRSLSPSSVQPKCKRSKIETIVGTPSSSREFSEESLFLKQESMFERFENKLELKFIDLLTRLDSIDMRLSSNLQRYSHR